MNWKRFIVRGLIWLVAELVLTFYGLDDLADYSEFIFDRHWHTQSRKPELAYAVVVPAMSIATMGANPQFIQNERLRLL